MVVSANNISIVYSGGTTNPDPSLSLGGNPSNVLVGGLINNIFPNVDSDEAAAGKIDYRAVYIFNDHSSATLYNSYVYIDTQVSGGATVQLGVHQETDTQQIVISPKPTGGNVIFSWESNNFTANYTTSTSFGNKIAAGLNWLVALSGVVATTTEDDDSVTVVLTFEGDDDNRNHELISLVTNNLTGSSPAITISKSTEGSPINAIATSIAVDTVAPVGVVFRDTSILSPIDIGDLAPGDGLPIWIKRTVPRSSEPLGDDGFTLKLIGDPFSS